jgi:Ca2+/H+ antiporter
MELTIGVSVGSSIQIAAGMIPLLVIIAWPLNKDLTLFFVSAIVHLPLTGHPDRGHVLRSVADQLFA